MKNFLITVLTLVITLTLTGQTLSGKHHIKYLEINTIKSDYGVTMLDDTKLVFTTPEDEKSRFAQQELFVGDINDEGEVVNKEMIKSTFDSKTSKSGVTYSRDRRTVYFSAKKYRKRKNTKEKYQLFQADVDDTGNWVNIEKVSFNNKKYSFEQPSLSADGTKLYFVSDMTPSYGGTDIFVADVHEDGTLGEPKNLGEKINTYKDEITPFITEDNILYFSSNGRGDSVGNLDVYASEIFENTVSEPLHLESPVNSINDDFAYIVNSRKDGGYFASNRLQGQNNNDIYSFKIEEEVPEKCLQEIAGIVRDKETNQILNDAAITLFDNDGNQLEQTVTNENGEYRLTLDCNQTYTLVASTLHHKKEEHIVNTANYKNAPTLEANKFLEKKLISDTEVATANDENKTKSIEETTEDTLDNTTDSEEVAESLSPVYFGFDRSDITAAAATELDKVAEIMKENEVLNLEVAAYTDARGSSAYNIQLSNRRAQSTIDYLVSKGVKRSRITGKGYGESKMVNKCIDGVECSEASHAKNRRTELNFIGSGKFTSDREKISKPIEQNRDEFTEIKNTKVLVSNDVTEYVNAYYFNNTIIKNKSMNSRLYL